MLEVVLHAFILGLGLIMPLGIQNMFVFNQGANQTSYVRTLPVVLTAALCDSLLILMAVLGVSVVVLNFSWLQTVLYGFGFIFLLYMGWVLWKSKSDGQTAPTEHSSKKQIIFAVSVSLLNPHAIMDTVGVIGINSLKYASGDRWVFTISIILTSWLWFFILAFIGRQVGKRDTNGSFINKLNKVSACIMWALGIYMGMKLFM